MKKIGKKLALLSTIILGLGCVLYSHASMIWIGPAGNKIAWDNMNFLSKTFWDSNPTTGDIVKATFGRVEDPMTAYTQTRSGYTSTDCDLTNMTITMIDPEDTGIFNDVDTPLTDNTIYILPSGNYDYTSSSDISLEGKSCIGFFGSGNVTIEDAINFSGANKIIIDNISTPAIQIKTNSYANTGIQNVEITSLIPLDINYIITGNISNIVTGTINNNIHGRAINLSGNDGQKDIHISMSYNTITYHEGKSIILDTLTPLLIGINQKGEMVTESGSYNTGVSFSFVDINLSGTLLNGNLYTGILITGAGEYTIQTKDLAGNTTGFHFSIDYTNPTFNGITQGGTVVNNSGFYNTGISFTFADTHLSGATINGNIYSGGDVLVNDGVYIFNVKDKAGNNTGIKFYIDQVIPSCSEYSPTTGSNINADKLSLTWRASDGLAGISGQTIIIKDIHDNVVLSQDVPTTGNSFDFTGDSGTYFWKVVVTDNAGNISNMGYQLVNYTKPTLVSLQIPGNIYQNKYYISGNVAEFTITGNKAFGYQFVGDVNSSSYFLYENGIVKKNITLSGSDGTKVVTMNYMTGTQTGAIGPISFFVDTVKPTLTGEFPTHLMKTKDTSINFRWSANDTGAGIKNYILEFGNINDGMAIIYTGNVNTFTVNNMSGGIYEWRVSAVDYAGNKKTTSITAFTIDTTIPTISGVTGNTYYKTNVTPVFDGSGSLNNRPFNSNTTITGDGNYTLIVSNDVGNSATISFVIDKTSPVVNTINPANNSLIQTNNTIAFNWNGSDTNFSGYEFSLQGTFYNTGFKTASNSVTIPTLENDTYTRSVKAIDKAGNETNSTSATFTVSLVLTGNVAISGSVNSGDIAYSRDNLLVQVSTNKNASIFIGGDVLQNIVGEITANSIRALSVTPIGGDGLKTFNVQVSNGIESFSKTVNGYIDTTGPSTPTFDGLGNRFTGDDTIRWNVASDIGVGVGSYYYQIVKGSTVKEGTTNTNSVSISNGEIGTTGTYVIYVSATDKLGNKGLSGSMTFTYRENLDISPNSFSFDKIYDADLDEEYESEKITVAGLSDGTTVAASVSGDATLLINGDEVDGTGYVQNGDKVQIVIFSSEDYDEITQGTLYIGDKSATFKVVTIKEDNKNNDDEDVDYEDDGESSDEYDISELSNSQKLHISIIYNTLLDMYNDDDDQQEDFMLSFKYIVKDKLEEMEDDDESETSIETLKYLYNLINRDFEGDSSSSSTKTTQYTAPNGKEYTIKYTKGDGYYSNNFAKVKYFDTLSDIKEYIDKNNPKNVYVGGDYDIDQSRSTSTYTAPNGKTYTFFKTTDGKYGSNNFASVKLFNDLATMKKHIDVNNPKK